MPWLLLAACTGSVAVPAPDATSPTSSVTTPAPAPVPAPEVHALCEPIVTFSPIHPTEGEEIRATVTCANGRDPAAFLLEFDSVMPWAPDATGATWTPGLADAGLVVLAVTVRDPADPAHFDPGGGAVSVADRWWAGDNTLVDPAVYTEEWGLPVLHLAPAGVVTQDYTPMNAWFDGAAYTGQIKIRGAASAGYPKPSYTLEFEPEQLHLADAPDKDHLVLISNFDDQSHLRQRLVFDTWGAMAAAWGETRLAPRPWPVVVYQGGVYQGLFLAVDHIDDEFVGEAGLDPLGNVYKSVSHDANFYLWTAAQQPKVPLSLGWEKKEGEPLTDFSDLDALTTWAATSSDATFAAEVDTWLPRTEFMDWFLLVHTLACDDSGGKNAYLYHNAGGQYRYAPWDFNHSVGQSWTTDRVPATEYNDFIWTNAIFGHLENEPVLSAELWSRYDAMRADGATLSLSNQLERIDAWSAETLDSATRDWGRWESDYRSYWYWRDDIWDPAGETDYIRQWLADRDVYLDTVH
jgi:hypothetical protein